MADVIPLTQHSLSLELRTDPIKGRGVFTRDKLKMHCLIEISPILLFNAEEYDKHGRYTILDEYTYCWPGGFALALGLGSMFNHNNTPNVGFIRDIPNKLIRYVALRDINPEEELCISYGNHLWFDDDSAVKHVIDSDEDKILPYESTDEE
ncbi:hypothetical protein BDB01DRAFT_781285 [Pilobolus umbonatus]|nr:hypothetical protein BDB01DRAFT_781285 [Pilobolus umbonatus]